MNQIKQWLTRPVVEDLGIDRPFRLRRISLLMVIAGWMIFLVSCLIGLWLKQHGQVVAGYSELFSILTGGDANARLGRTAVQVIIKLTELAGASLFIGGMISVSLFDKIDRVPIWRVE